MCDYVIAIKSSKLGRFTDVVDKIKAKGFKVKLTYSTLGMMLGSIDDIHKLDEVTEIEMVDLARSVQLKVL